MEGIDLQTRDLFGWFAERILEARQKRERHDVLGEEEPACTIYLAGLLTHMTSRQWLVHLDQKGERLDMDVAHRASKEGSPRQRLETYQAAADRYLLYLGLWDGLQGNQQGRYYQITEDNLANRASAYYGFAADLAGRMPPPRSQHVRVFQEFAINLRAWLGTLLSLRGDILGLYPTLSPGEEFHLSLT
ncbi:MAG: hypothetical protein H6686_12150 [Fibrobacteria bacterium]|nr:hypothetical protein [Fibrobacteria bacterium]